MNYRVTDAELTSVANAIRQKGGTTEPLTWESEFVSAIRAIPSPSGSISFSQNGTYDVASYASAIVSVPIASGSISISSNGTYDVLAFADAVVSVPIASGEIEISQNGSHDVTAYSNAVVNVQGGSVNPDNFKIAIGVKSGSVYDTLASYVTKYAFYNRNTDYGQPITGVEMTNVESLWVGAFSYCSQLTEAKFPVCSIISNAAFNSCVALSYIYFPSAKTIGWNAFHGCINLTRVDFPYCCEISSFAFRECSALESVYLLSATKVRLSNANAFFSTPMSDSSYLGHFGSIYVPSRLVSAYKSASNWSVYSDRITAYIE